MQCEPAFTSAVRECGRSRTCDELKLKCAPIGFRKGSKIILLRKCSMAAGVLILSPPSSALANCVAHCLLIQRGMEANAQGSSVAEWSESSGILHEDLGTV